MIVWEKNPRTPKKKKKKKLNSKRDVEDVIIRLCTV
jgi:hypothetical protein